MPAKKYIVCLNKEKRNHLLQLVKTGKVAAYKRQRAHSLLKADVNREGQSLQNKEIANSLDVGVCTVERTRQRLVEHGFENVLEREPRKNSRPRRLDGEQEAHLMVSLEYVDWVCPETVRKTLKKTR